MHQTLPTETLEYITVVHPPVNLNRHRTKTYLKLVEENWAGPFPH